jgi:hypothetical protein
MGSFPGRYNGEIKRDPEYQAGRWQAIKGDNKPVYDKGKGSTPRLRINND